ncbi:MAG: RluA family pseudouridine synthase [Oceanidesulfovibrio sp.]
MNDVNHDQSSPNQIVVGPEEAGQKLFQFLIRRTGLPGGAVMRLVRTGQVRVDGKRAKPYMRLDTGVVVRIPPKLAEELVVVSARPPQDTHAPLQVLAEEHGLLAVRKPSGLPTHGGSGHSDSLASRLAAAKPDAPFTPTPAHRLDKDTSGVLLAAVSYRALAALQEAFRERTVDKRYLAWVSGDFPSGGPYRLEDVLEKSGGPGSQRMRTSAVSGKLALSDVRLIEHRDGACLVEIRLLTGRTHQIRVQLASRGHPILGDAKYGTAAEMPLLLHAWRIGIPEGTLPGAPAYGRLVYECLPDWSDGYAVWAAPGEWPREPAVSWTVRSIGPGVPGPRGSSRESG